MCGGVRSPSALQFRCWPCSLVSIQWRSDNTTTTIRASVAYHLGMAPRYLGPFVRFADLPGRRAFRSAVTNRLTVPAVKLSKIGSRAFSVSGPQTWNQLPEEITSATSLKSLSTFQRHLKTFLFRKSFPEIIADWHFSGPCGNLNYLGHSKKIMIDWLIDWLISSHIPPLQKCHQNSSTTRQLAVILLITKITYVT